MGLFDIFKNKNYEINEEDIDYSDYENEEFEMIVEDIFSITGRGTVVTGEITSGIISVGEKVYINDEFESNIIGIEMFRKSLECAYRGNKVGLLLNNVSKKDINKR